VRAAHLSVGDEDADEIRERVRDPVNAERADGLRAGGDLRAAAAAWPA
jgi:hypothetical protein